MYPQYSPGWLHKSYYALITDEQSNGLNYEIGEHGYFRSEIETPFLWNLQY